jgi:predicted ATPase
MLFIGACRVDEDVAGVTPMNNFLQQLESCGNTTYLTLRGFTLESLNEMISEALCLPRRKTRSLSEVVYQKTQGMPLFVIEVRYAAVQFICLHLFSRSYRLLSLDCITKFLDALLTEKLLFHDAATGWDWDVDSVDLKAISKSVAELLTRKLQRLPPDVLTGLKVASSFGPHVDFHVIEAIEDFDSSESSIMPALLAARAEGLIDIAGQTSSFTHDLIQQAAFGLIPTADRVALLLKLVSCLMGKASAESDPDCFLFVTADLVNRIGRDGVSNNPDQSRLFAQLNLKAGRKAMSMTDFVSALKYLTSGVTFLQGDYWRHSYLLSLGLFENLASANYLNGQHDQAFVQVKKVLDNATCFEHKFNCYCVYINILAVGSIDRAMDKIYELLPYVGENINRSDVDQEHVLRETVSLKHSLSGGQKDKLLQMRPMEDRTKLMAMKLLSILVLHYNSQRTFMGGYLAGKMIRISMEYGHCEDTIYAISIFSCAMLHIFNDLNEASDLVRTALSLMQYYNAENLIPRVYGLIYGVVLVLKVQVHATLDPLLRACRLSFTNGNYEHATLNTILYVGRCFSCGKKLPLMLSEVNAFTQQHVSSVES